MQLLHRTRFTDARQLGHILVMDNGVLVFNLAVTFYIGEMLLGFLGTLISLAIFSLALFRVKQVN